MRDTVPYVVAMVFLGTYPVVELITVPWIFAPRDGADPVIAHWAGGPAARSPGTSRGRARRTGQTELEAQYLVV